MTLSPLAWTPFKCPFKVRQFKNKTSLVPLMLTSKSSSNRKDTDFWWTCHRPSQTSKPYQTYVHQYQGTCNVNWKRWEVWFKFIKMTLRQVTVRAWCWKLWLMMVKSSHRACPGHGEQSHASILPDCRRCWKFTPTIKLELEWMCANMWWQPHGFHPSFHRSNIVYSNSSGLVKWCIGPLAAYWTIFSLNQLEHASV